MTYRISFLSSNHFIIIIIVDYFVILFPVGSQSDNVYFPPPRPSKRSLNGDSALNINRDASCIMQRLERRQATADELSALRPKSKSGDKTLHGVLVPYQALVGKENGIGRSGPDLKANEVRSLTSVFDEVTIDRETNPGLLTKLIKFRFR